MLDECLGLGEGMHMRAADDAEDEQEDLSPVLSNIGMDKLKVTRARLANSPATRDFLEIGLSLLQDDLLEHRGPDFDQGDRSRLFESLSRARILTRAAELDPDEQKLLTVNMFRHRWDRKDRYTEDLISYLFRLSPQRERLKEMERLALAMLNKASLKELAQKLAAAEVDMILVDPIFNLQTIIQAALPNHPRVREFSEAQHEMLLTGWARLYEQIAVAYGLQLKPGFIWSDIALLFNAVAEGSLIRARINGAEAVLSNGERVLAGAIFVMLPSIVDGLPEDYGTLYARQNI
jgi:hypothetical protein